jgi:hypothetical protein
MEFDSYCSKVLTEMQQGTLSGDERTWLYCGVFLYGESKRQLMDRVKYWFRDGIPNDWKWYCDHVTMVFNNGSPEAEAEYNKIVETELGKEVELTVTSVGLKNDVVAVGVTGVRSANKHIHITCATAPTTKPVESNRIVTWKQLNHPFHLYGRVDVRRPHSNFKK